MAPKIVGLVAHPEKEGAAEAVRALEAEFARNGIETRLDSGAALLVGRMSAPGIAALGDAVDLLVVLGGDGTILRVVHEVGPGTKPIFGINLGSFGFLTCLNWSDHEEAVSCVVESSYVLSPRTLLRVELERAGEIVHRDLGLNDAVLSRGSARLARIAAMIDGHFLNEFHGDGLIVATPTGSTAYSLAAGGPIVNPDTAVLLLTPICPHVLDNRSVILDDDAVIELTSPPSSEAPRLSIDGRKSLVTMPGDIVRIRKAPRRLPLATLPHLSFFEVLRRKFQWSGSTI